jgi:hypothetical protein
MNPVKNITKLILSFLLIGIVGMLVVNEAIYTHTHQINGHLVTHSHPYSNPSDSSSAPAHQHNKTQLAFWGNIEILFPLTVLAFLMLNISKPVFRSIQSIIFVYTAPQVHYPGRAPPAS